MTVRRFSAATDAHPLRSLHTALTGEGIAPGLTVGQLESVFQTQGWLAFQDGRCVAAASIIPADAATEADLIWMAKPGISNEVRKSLLDAVLVSARQIGASTLLCYLHESDLANLSFMDMEICISEIVAGYSRWTANLGLGVEAKAPEGISIEVSDSADALLIATRVAWDDLPGHKPATRDAIREAVVAYGAANQFLLLDGSGTPVGIVRGLMLSENEAYVDAPGLALEWRQPEKYAFLLAHVTSHLAGLGAHTALMESWGDPPVAMDGFHSAGWVREVFMPARRILVNPTAD